MTLLAFIGPAGVGKTYQLMLALTQALADRPLQEGQRILALTFMHGSRQRLDDRLRTVPGLNGRYLCSTIDRFAWELCVRWRTLSRHLALPDNPDNQYDATCNIAGMLLERPDVRGWITRSYPHIVVDEAQDLKPERLRIISALEPDVQMFVAADEFQCLDQALRPNPAIAWIGERTEPHILNLPRRTEIPGLLAAAHAVRAGEPLRSDRRSFTLLSAPGRPPFALAAAGLTNAIAWKRSNDAAVITPSKVGGFAVRVVQRVTEGPIGAQQNGPYPVIWESSNEEELALLLARLVLPNDGNIDTILAALDLADDHPAMRLCGNWIRRQRSLGAMAICPPDQVRERLSKCINQCRRHSRSTASHFKAMTVHQAKNREFDGVVVLWPYAVAGDNEQQRRLLYNATTRARRWCTVIAQGADILVRPPFTAN